MTPQRKVTVCFYASLKYCHSLTFTPELLEILSCHVNSAITNIMSLAFVHVIRSVTLMSDTVEGEGERKRASSSICREGTSAARDTDDSCTETWRVRTQSVNTSEWCVTFHLNHMIHCINGE